MSLFSRRESQKTDYRDRVYAMHLLKKYEIEALEYQEKTKGAPYLANEIHGLRNIVDVVPLWLVGQTDGTDLHQWIIAKIDSRNDDIAIELYVNGDYEQILPLSYTECIDEWYNKQGTWKSRI